MDEPVREMIISCLTTGGGTTEKISEFQVETTKLAGHFVSRI